MKFSILTVAFLYGANAATRGGRQATQRSCEPCSHEVCASDLNACPDTNPFLCLEGKAYRGCTSIEDIFLNPEDCHECCDLSSCDDPPPPTCEPCSYDVCASDLNACPHTNPFVCLEGKAKSGCTSIEEIWLNPEDCHECCDLSHCPEEPKYDPPTHPPTKYDPPTHPPTKYDPPTHPPTKYDPPTHPPTKYDPPTHPPTKYDPPTHPPTKYDPPTHPPTKYDPKRSCEPCSHEVCASELNACPHTNPFVCLEGKAKSGCTSIEEVWLNPEDCHECCDLSYCPEEPKYDPPTHPPTKYEEKPKGDLILYNDASGDTSFFNIDEHCPPDEFCVGTVIPFKNHVYYDEHLQHKAGYNIGHCIVVADDDQVLYCVFSVNIKHEGEISLQGYGTLKPDGSTFLITAGSGTYKGVEGSLHSTPTDETNTKYKYSFSFHY